MPPSFGLFKKMPFTEGVPSFVTSNPHWESVKEWKNQVESKLKNYQLVTLFLKTNKTLCMVITGAK